MDYKDYMKILEDNNLHVHKDNIIYRHGKGNKNRPICNNDIFQDLVVKKMNGDITDAEYELLGIFIHTLIRIVLNNEKFRFQTDTVRDDVTGEAYLDILTAMEKKWYKPAKGTAYAYFFRLAYVAGIHVLEAENRQKKIVSDLMESFKDYYGVDFKENTDGKQSFSELMAEH